jgi:hypothetical protein
MYIATEVDRRVPRLNLIVTHNPGGVPGQENREKFETLEC